MYQKNLPDAHVINKSYIGASAFPRLLCQIRAQAREFPKSYIVRRTSYIATAFSNAFALTLGKRKLAWDARYWHNCRYERMDKIACNGNMGHDANHRASGVWRCVHRHWTTGVDERVCGEYKGTCVVECRGEISLDGHRALHLVSCRGT